MTNEPRLIQQAYKITKTNEIVNSSHTHDCVIKVVMGETLMIDGGTDYSRCSGNFEKLIKSGDIISLMLYSDASIEQKAEKLIWGTRGKNGDQPLKYVLMKDCETDHLNAILETQIITKDRRNVIEYIIRKRKIESI